MTRLSFAAISLALASFVATSASAAPSTTTRSYFLGCEVESVDRAGGKIVVRISNGNRRNFQPGKTVSVRLVARVGGVLRSSTVDVALPAELKAKGAVSVAIKRDPRVTYACSARVVVKLDPTGPAKKAPTTREGARS
jgi:hypothetical protein